MRIKATECMEQIEIGKVGENIVTEVLFSEYEGFPASLTYLRPGADEPYPVLLTETEGGWLWTVTSTDLANAGWGRAEVVYIEGEAVKLSRTWRVVVKSSLEPAGAVPEPWESYYEEIIAAGNTAAQKATEAAQSASSAATSAENAEQSAESASESAGTASAKADAVLDLTVSAESLAEGASATAERSIVGGHYNINFGIPRGDTGAKGDKGEKGDTGATGPQGPQGDAGFSPTATVTQDGDITTIEVTDEQGTTSARINLSEYMKKSDAWAMLPTDTASGAIASFPDGADDVPMISLVANVEPVQDLHGYDAPWPAGGGTNLLNIVPQSGVVSGISYTVDDDGYITLNGTSGIACNIVLEEHISTFDSQVTLSSNVRIANGIYTGLVQQNGNIGLLEITPAFQTRTSGTDGINQEARYRIYIVPNTTLENFTFRVMLNYGSTALDWSPYENECPISGWTAAGVNVNGEPITHSFTDELGNTLTVYGGEYELIGGKLKVTRGEIDSYAGESINEPWISSLDAYTPGGTPTTGAQVVYMLAVPREYNLPPVEVRTLYGDNTIFADCGNVSVTYKADVQKWVEKKLGQRGGTP